MININSWNYFILNYETNYCGIYDTFILKTKLNFDEVEDIWNEKAYDLAQDYYEEDEDEEDLEVYSSVEEVNSKEFDKLLEDGHEEIAI